jgi:hypothetical protein
MSSFAGYSSYGNMFGYVLGAGAAVGMPAGSLNQNAFILGTAATYLGGPLTQRGVNMYSNLSNAPAGPSSFSVRLGVPGRIASGALAGPSRAFFPNSTARTYGPPATTPPSVSPY